MADVHEVLFLEDSPTFAEWLHIRLGESDSEFLPQLTVVTCVADATAALQSDKTRWSAILTDLNLPDSRGLETVHRLREVAPEAPPIIVLTGSLEKELGLRAVRAGAHDYLNKDELTGSMLARCLRYAIERTDADRQLREARLLRAQRMEAMGQLAGGLAHDVNNMLAVIMGQTEGLLESASEAQHAALESILGAADSTSAMIHRLLAFSRRQVLQPTRICVDDIITDTLRMIRPTMPPGLAFVVRLAAQQAWANADRALLEQMLVNLLVNARDAMPEGGSITITTAVDRIPPGATRQKVRMRAGTYTRIRVADTGSGLPPEVLQRCFEPFFSTKSDTEGTGLGLASVYGIIKQHRGYVFAESDSNGASFDLLLPSTRHRPETKTAPTAAGEAREVRGNGTILIAEDKPPLRSLIHRMLTRAGYDALVSSEEEDAYRVAAQHDGRIDLLICDVVMPRSDVRRLAQRLRESYPDLAVLYVSGFPMAHLSPTDLLDSDAGFLRKPFKSKELLEAVRLRLS